MIAESQNIVLRYVQRRVLLFSLVLLTLLSIITAALARAYHAREDGLVEEWFQNGTADLAAGNPGKAFEDFRNSLSYGPENTRVQLRLAEALLADGRFSEARSYLVNLWNQSPGSGEVNLDLAHVSAQSEDTDQAVRYYRGAISGSWEQEPAEQRRKVRLELCEYLLAHGRIDDAQSEISGLAADTPSGDGALREQNGLLFLKVGASGKALEEFEAALQINPRQSEWLADAGQVAFDEGDYLKAEAYFSKADREDPSNKTHGALLLVRDILGNDPFLAGLSEEEQARRSLRDFKLGVERLGDCLGTGAKSTPPVPPPPELQPLNEEAKDLQKRINLGFLSKNPELQDEAMQFVSQVENMTARSCGPPQGVHQALILIEKRHEGNNP